MKNRQIWIDAVKGVGIIAVMLSHIQHVTGLKYISAGMIPLFLICSGYISKPITSKEIVLTRLKRLLIPYLFYSAIIYILFTLDDVKDGNYLKSLNEFIGIFYARFCLFPWGSKDQVLFCSANGPLWYLPYYFVCTLVLLFYDSIVLPSLKFIYIFVALLISAASMYLPILLPWSVDMCTLGFIFILCGRLMRPCLINSGNGLLQICIFLICGVTYYILLNNIGYLNVSVREYGNPYWGGYSLYLE